ncbi:MAG: glycoprotease family protein [Candidatus Xenolissoclinum pacificiensis L6]|uniref:Glycoprotease family protein n=1 Tax=Candidatus Xenolissoclinum pacificiensis L6 TaxID=1401685 RepID=W2V0S5_9RICK|nr:MAG: glycoprotease family protein [Candidatus Xenolissoclinum pacificiensis L6]
MSHTLALSLCATTTNFSISIFEMENLNKIVTYHNTKLQIVGYLLAILQDLMTRYSLSFSNIHHLITCNGPGMFTSIRAGVAALQGIGLVNKIPVYGIDAMPALAFKYSTDYPHNQDNFIDVVYRISNCSLYFERFDHSLISRLPLCRLKNNKYLKHEKFNSVGNIKECTYEIELDSEVIMHHFVATKSREVNIIYTY